VSGADTLAALAGAAPGSGAADKILQGKESPSYLQPNAARALPLGTPTLCQVLALAWLPCIIDGSEKKI
jgi:hypothetical protein